MAELVERCGCGAEMRVKLSWLDHPNRAAMLLRAWRTEHQGVCPLVHIAQKV